MRVPSFLADQQVPFETMVHPPAFTAARRAHVLHLPGQQLAKCVLLSGPRGQFVAVLPATHQIDMAVLSRKLEGPVRLARTNEIGETFRDCEWGVLVPFGTLYGVPTIIDDGLRADSMLVFESHTHGVAIGMRCRDFELLEKPRRFGFGVRDLPK